MYFVYKFYKFNYGKIQAQKELVFIVSSLHKINKWYFYLSFVLLSLNLKYAKNILDTDKIDERFEKID